MSSLRGKKLREIRVALRMTQTLFASITGIGFGTIQSYEADNTEVGLVVLEKVIHCQAFEKFALWLICNKPTTCQQVKPILPWHCKDQAAMNAEHANSLADRAKLIRTSEGLTQHELSQLTGISPGVISNYESGKKRMGLKVIDRLIQHPRFDKYAFWFFTGKTDTSEQITPAELNSVSILPSSVDLSSPVSNPDDWFTDIDRAIENVPMSRTRQQTAKIVARLTDEELKEILDKIEEYRRNKSPEQYDSAPDSKNRDVG